MKLESVIPSKIFQLDEPSQALLIEALRAEVSAAKSLRRTVLVRRVCTRLQLDKAYQEKLNNIIDKLVIQRDVLAIEQGFIVVTPIRGIILNPSRTRLLCALPTSRLEEMLNHSVTGVEKRTVKSDVSELEVLIAEADGQCLTVEIFSSISEATVANQQWLNGLKRRQADVRSKEYSVESVESFRWYKQKWLAYSDTDAKQKLWRGEDSYGKAVYVWSDKVDLMNGKGLRLTGADAARARYALDRLALHSHHMSYKKIKGGYRLAVEKYLPVNEFKALNCFSYSEEVVDNINFYYIYTDCLEKLKNILNTQLGIELIEEN